MAKRTTRFAIAALALLCLPHASFAKAPFVVILDPGHGGEDTGALRELEGRTVAEKDITLAIAREAAKLFRKRGITAKLTRFDDTFIDLDNRTIAANKGAKGAAQSVFVSIHANAVDDETSAGIETYVFNAATNEASRHLADLENGKRWTKAHATLDLILADLATTANFGDSADLACDIQSEAVSRLSSRGLATRDRGIRQALFYVLMRTAMPSVLFEPGFLSNPLELARLATPVYQRVLAQSLVDGVLKWRTQARARTSKARLAAARGGRVVSAVAKRPCQIH